MSRRYRLPSQDLAVRELEVAGLLADGLDTNQIAAELSISAGTVRTHIKRACERKNFGNRYQLIAWTRQRRAA